MSKAITISLSGHKGGIGKTTTAASLGGILSLSGTQKVLLVDLDPQQNLTTTFTDGQFEKTVYDAFAQYKAERHAELPIYNIRENLDIAPAHIRLATVDTDFASLIGREYMLRRILEPLKEKYDWIFIDCPAQIGCLTANALMAADKVIIPMTCDAYSSDGLQQINGFIENVKMLNEDLDILGIVVTKYNGRRVVDKNVVDVLRKEWGSLLFDTAIREHSAIVKAPLMKRDVATYDRTCNGTKDYLALLGEIVNRVNN